MRKNHHQKNVAQESENKVFSRDERICLKSFYQEQEEKITDIINHLELQKICREDKLKDFKDFFNSESQTILRRQKKGKEALEIWKNFKEEIQLISDLMKELNDRKKIIHKTIVFIEKNQLEWDDKKEIIRLYKDNLTERVDTLCLKIKNLEENLITQIKQTNGRYNALKDLVKSNRLTTWMSNMQLLSFHTAAICLLLGGTTYLISKSLGLFAQSVQESDQCPEERETFEI